jgi:hypothetical protein
LSAVSPEGRLVFVTGFGNHPNLQHAHGIFELFVAGDCYPTHANWGTV